MASHPDGDDDACDGERRVDADGAPAADAESPATTDAESDVAQSAATGGSTEPASAGARAESSATTSKSDSESTGGRGQSAGPAESDGSPRAGSAGGDEAQSTSTGSLPSVDELLYEGESVSASLAVGDARLVATSHRVLALVPDAAPRVRTCERANVDEVDVDTDASTGLLRPAVQGLVVGVVLLLAGRSVSLDGLLTTDVSAPGTGLGGLFATLELVATALAVLDEALLLAGGVTLAAGLAAVGRYLQSRTPVVRVTVAGGADIVVPGEVADRRDLYAFRDAVRYD